MPSPDLRGSRVLVLDGHTNQALACVRSLGRAGATVFVASPEPVPLAGWSRYCRSRFRQSGEDVAAFAALRHWAHEHAVDVVLPQRERSSVLCAGGRGKGVFALYDHGEPVVWFAHERLRDFRPSGSGSSLRRSIAVDPRLREPASRLLSAMQWHGPAMVEFRDDGADEPYLMEVNGRFWGSLELAVSAGVDFPALWTGLVRGQRVEASGSYETGVTSRWLWGDVKRMLFIIAGPPAGCRDPYPGILEGLREV